MHQILVYTNALNDSERKFLSSREWYFADGLRVFALIILHLLKAEAPAHRYFGDENGAILFVFTASLNEAFEYFKVFALTSRRQ